MMNISERKRIIIDLLETTCCGFLPFFVFFIFIPTTLFIGNLAEFQYDYTIMLSLYFLAGAFFIFLFAVFSLLPSLMRSHIARVLFWIGIFILISDMLCPLKWKVSEWHHIFKEPLKQSLIQCLIAEFVLGCAILIPRIRLQTVGVIFTLMLILAQTTNLLVISLNIPKPHKPAYMMPRSQRSNESIDTVYHIIFDAYCSDTFRPLLNDPEYAEQLRGFIFFKNTFSNYITTGLSVSSFLSGSLYSSNETLSEWFIRAAESGIFKTVIEDGWRLWMYVPDDGYTGKPSQKANIIAVPKLLNKGLVKLKTFRLLKFSFVRIAPVWWRTEAAAFANDVFGFIFFLFRSDIVKAHELPEYKHSDEIEYLAQVPMCLYFIDKEQQQQEHGRYVYAHFIYPHSPYIWDAEYQFSQNSDYEVQCRGVANFISEFINMLKENGRFDNSLIIIQADHGLTSGATTPQEYPIPEHIMQSLDVGCDAEGLYAYARPLLLIKPPFADNEQLRYNEIPVQLKDLPATVYDVLNIDQTTNDGQSILRVPVDDDREIHIFVNDTDKSYPPTSLSHISFSRFRGWQRYNDINVVTKKKKKLALPPPSRKASADRRRFSSIG
ncbi:sulfatase-like hydrolase/transferase [Candidatus Omnitrophota bacterium]